jgi:hypothetical protein
MPKRCICWQRFNRAKTISSKHSELSDGQFVASQMNRANIFYSPAFSKEWVATMKLGLRWQKFQDFARSHKTRRLSRSDPSRRRSVRFIAALFGVC